jgi:hypothetical protein
MNPEITYTDDCVCECGATYVEHNKDRYGLRWCPVEGMQSFSPFLLLWPISQHVN